MPRKKKIRFPFGEIVTTSGAVDLLDRAGVNANDLLERHQRCDHGAIDPAEIAKNRRALRRGQPLRSAYDLGDHREQLWIITSADRLVTTLMIPHEFADMNRAHLIQWFHPALHIGLTASAAHGDTLIPVHCRQGIWDSACGGHCVAMALALWGDIADVDELCERRAGVAARLWKATQGIYFKGATVGELAAIVDSLKTGRLVEPFLGNHRQCLAYAQTQLANGRVVIASWYSRQGRQKHWTLIIGCEGLRVGATFTPHALLALDPAVAAPQFAGCNARLEFPAHAGPRGKSLARYLTQEGDEWWVQLTSALTIGDRV
jgi:hypothetical protein